MSSSPLLLTVIWRIPVRIGMNSVWVLHDNGIQIGVLGIPELWLTQIGGLPAVVDGVVGSTDGDGLAIGPDLDIGQMPCLPGEQVHVPEDAVHTEKVLILQIAARAPLDHLGHQAVLPFADKWRQVKLGWQVTALAVADIWPLQYRRRQELTPSKTT